VLAQLARVPDVIDNLAALGVELDGPEALQAAAGEFVLEGLWAQKKIGRSDDRGFVASERRAELEVDVERLERLRRLKKQVN
jgi:magnesium chelatase subunit I